METETLKLVQSFLRPFHKILFKISDSNGPTYSYYSYIHVLLITTWLYLQIYRHCLNQIWQDSKLTFTDFTEHVMITSPQLGHVNNVYGFISTYISPINKETWQTILVDQHALNLQQ